MQTHASLLTVALSIQLVLAACGGGGNGGSGGAGGDGFKDHPSGGQGGGHISTSSSGDSSSAGPGGTGGSTGSSGCPIFPADNPWNTDISNAEVDALSDQYLASMGLNTGLHPDFGSAPDNGIPSVKVDSTVSKSKVVFDEAPDESDPGPYPIPKSPPIEVGSDHHLLMIQTDECKLYELFGVAQQADGWHAGSGAIWSLKSNDLRPDGWTSADAAGLPIYPGLARYEEATGEGMNHALRFTVKKSQSAYVFPARHSAGAGSDPSLPPMGLRVRLKASFDIGKLTPQAQAVAKTLKKYGMLLADNGGPLYITGTANPGWDDDDLHNLNQIHGSDLEVIKTGPLSKGP